MEHEVLAEVDSAYLFVIGEVFGRAGFEDFAFEKKVGAVGDGEGFLYIVVGDEHANVFLFEFDDNALNVFYGYGVDARKGFIEEDKLRVGGEGASDFGASAFASAEHVAHAFAHTVEAKLF